ncbi:MAG: hypothetical protein RLZZ227_105 [Pseudomonadota bacterium]|jgi:hypothetical protein
MWQKCSRSVVVLALCGSWAAAQEPTEPVVALQEAPEEIIVTGERSTMQLRIQVMEAEVQAYEIFNQFNDDRRFDISCSVQERTGSRFVQQLCEPEFIIQANRGHALDFLSTMPGRSASEGSSSHQYGPMAVEIQRHQPAYRQKLKQIAEEHPEFLEALVRFTSLKQEYESRTDKPE